MMDSPRFRRFYLPAGNGADTPEERVEITTDWPDVTAATREFIETADPVWLHREYRTVFFHLSNGAATYRIAQREAGRVGIYFLRRVG